MPPRGSVSVPQRKTTKKKTRKKKPVVVNDNGYFEDFIDERFRNQELIIKGVKKDIPNLIRDAVKAEHLGCTTRIDWEGNGNEDEPSYKKRIDEFLTRGQCFLYGIVVGIFEIEFVLITDVYCARVRPNSFPSFVEYPFEKDVQILYLVEI